MEIYHLLSAISIIWIDCQAGREFDRNLPAAPQAQALAQAALQALAQAAPQEHQFGIQRRHTGGHVWYIFRQSDCLIRSRPKVNYSGASNYWFSDALVASLLHLYYQIYCSISWILKRPISISLTHWFMVPKLRSNPTVVDLRSDPKVEDLRSDTTADQRFIKCLRYLSWPIFILIFRLVVFKGRRLEERIVSNLDAIKLFCIDVLPKKGNIKASKVLCLIDLLS